MSQFVKRVKGGKTHYAKMFAPAGNVTAWTTHEHEAKRFDANDTADRVLAMNLCQHYVGAPNVGVLTFEPGAKPINDAKKALQEEADREKAEAESLATLRDKAARFDAVEAARVKAFEELAMFKAKVHELEREVAELKKPAVSMIGKAPDTEPAKADPKAEVKLVPSDAPSQYPSKKK